MLNNIILIGFMGCGKTTIGREVAKLYNSVLIDTDSIIEANYDMPISELFVRFGEAEFRRYETYLCDWIRLNIKNAVISTGGGMPVHCDLRDIGNVFYLQAPLEVLIERIESDGSSKRPLLRASVPIADLYNKRIKYYEQMADYTLNAMEGANAIAQRICDYMKNY